jgi:hypothetical protein
VETASPDSNCPLTILRRFPQPAYFFKYDAEASFLLSQVSYLCILTSVGLSLTVVLSPGSSLSTGSGTWPGFSLLIQESPVIHQLHSLDLNQCLHPVQTLGDLQSTLQPHRQARSSPMSLGHSFDVRQRELEIVNMFITTLLLCGDRISGFKLSFGHSAPLPASGLFLFKYDAEASFLLPQLSYPFILTLVVLSLTLVLPSGSSFLAASRTWPDFSLLTQKSPTTR